MKKMVFLLLGGLLFLVSCNDEPKSYPEQEPDSQVPFTEDDIKLAEKMIMFASELEIDFAIAANKKWEELKKENPDLYNAELDFNEIKKDEREQAMKKAFNPLAKEMIVEPFFEEFGTFIYEDRSNLLPAINYTNFLQDGDKVEVERDFTFYPSYKNLTISSKSVELIDDFNIHELKFTINKDNTIFYKDYDDNDAGFASSYNKPSDVITFYKTKDDKFLIGIFPILGEYQHQITNNSSRQKEKSQELINSLPSLQ